jgi:hypothetical protein
VPDASLADELDAVRALAMPFEPRSVRRPWRRLLILALLWVTVFLAIWQLLSPVPRPQHRGVHSRKAVEPS